MEYRYRLTEKAVIDARSAFERIAKYSPDRADRWYQGLLTNLDSLRIFPLRCPRARESQKPGEVVRELLYGKRRSCYRILFVVRGDTVTVLAIRHASRGPGEL